MDDLNKLRENINEIDEQFLDLIAQRIEVVKAVGEYKKERGLPVIDRKREEELLQKLIQRGKKYSLDESIIRKVWKDFFEIAYELEK